MDHISSSIRCYAPILAFSKRKTESSNKGNISHMTPPSACSLSVLTGAAKENFAAFVRQFAAWPAPKTFQPPGAFVLRRCRQHGRIVVEVAFDLAAGVDDRARRGAAADRRGLRA